jgi:hypothetical protein
MVENNGPTSWRRAQLALDSAPGKQEVASGNLRVKLACSHLSAIQHFMKQIEGVHLVLPVKPFNHIGRAGLNPSLP